MNTKSYFAVVLLLMLSFENLFAFPDMVRHGYTSCRSCHVSPAGGGVLTAYGRSISKELLSSWSYEGQEEVLHGLPTSWLEKYKENFLVGGDIRSLKQKQKTEESSFDDSFLMQANVSFAWVNESVELVMQVGNIEDPRKSEKIQWVPTAYYLNLLLSDNNIVRLGRFNPHFGIELADHNLWIKSQTGQQPWMKRDSVEIYHQDESLGFSLSGFQSDDDSPPNFQTTGYIARLHYNLWDRNQLGINYKTEEGSLARNQVYGLWAKLSPWQSENYIFIEIDRLKSMTSVQDLVLLRGAREIIKGFSPFLQLQYQGKRHPRHENNWRYGAGFNFFPVPHTEIFFSFEETDTENGRAQETFLVFHYYL